MSFLKPSRLQVQTELLLKRCRRDFLTFCKFIHPGYKVGRHLVELTSTLQKVESGEIQRLMVCEPPRHGKSMTISQLFPAYFFGKRPSCDVIQCGYSDDISVFHSRHARKYFGSQRYAHVFPGVATRTDDEVRKQAVHEWTTLHGGRYRAAGIQSGISGRGADLIIIDDPIKNREDANSPAVREKVLQEYRSTLYTRLTPTGRIILVMTRWHPEDLAGTIRKQMESGGEPWTVLNMPAINASNEALWPEQFSIEKLHAIKQAIGSAEFQALYQQDPRLGDNAMFRREWFSKIVSEVPTGLRWCRAWDLASTASLGSNDPDYTAGALVGLGTDGVWYIKDIRTIRGRPMAVEQLIKQTAILDGPGVQIKMEREGGSSGVTVIDHYAREVLVGYNFSEIRADKAKDIRAGAFSAAAEAGNVRLVKGDWISSFLNQAELFPFGSHDDQIDAVVHAFNSLSLGFNRILVA